MMWNGHAETGLVAGLGWVLIVPPAGVVDGVGRVAVTVGYALAPDIDHRNALPSRMWGPVSGGIASAMHRVVGHRAGTHEVAAPVVGGGVAALLGSGLLGGVGVGLVWAWTAGLVLVIASAYKVLPRPRRRHSPPVSAFLHIVGAVVYSWPGRIAASVFVGWFAAENWEGLSWLGWAVALGIAAHLAGDACTKYGVPFTRWVPVRGEGGEVERDADGEPARLEKRTVMVGPRIFVTGSWAEKAARRILQTAAVILAVMIVWRYSPPEVREGLVTATVGVAQLAAGFVVSVIEGINTALR